MRLVSECSHLGLPESHQETSSAPSADQQEQSWKTALSSGDVQQHNGNLAVFGLPRTVNQMKAIAFERGFIPEASESSAGSGGGCLFVISSSRTCLLGLRPDLGENMLPRWDSSSTPYCLRGWAGRMFAYGGFTKVCEYKRRIRSGEDTLLLQ